MKAVLWVVVLSTVPSPSGGQMTENKRQTVSPFRDFTSAADGISFSRLGLFC